MKGPIDLDKLQAVAEAAASVPAHDLGLIFRVRETIEFAAAFDPPTVLALIAELREAREDVERSNKWRAVYSDRLSQVATLASAPFAVESDAARSEGEDG